MVLTALEVYGCLRLDCLGIVCLRGCCLRGVLVVV